MEISVALFLLLVFLAIAFAGARRAAKSRRRKILEERERQRRKKPKYKPRPMSDRTEMRAYDDPSTLAGDITTMGTPTTTTDNQRGKLDPAAQSRSAGTARAATDKQSRAPGKPRA
jgi:hypothetical protein